MLVEAPRKVRAGANKSAVADLRGRPARGVGAAARLPDEGGWGNDRTLDFRLHPSTLPMRIGRLGWCRRAGDLLLRPAPRRRCFWIGAEVDVRRNRQLRAELRRLVQ